MRKKSCENCKHQKPVEHPNLSYRNKCMSPRSPVFSIPIEKLKTFWCKWFEWNKKKK